MVKVLIINTLISSLFIYKMQVLPFLPSKLIKQIEMEFEKFIWNGRKPKIPLKILMNSKEDGGLALINLSLKDMA